MASLGFADDILYTESSDILPFPVCIPFLSFSPLITVARTSKMILNKPTTVEHRELCSMLYGSLDGREFGENGHMCMYG